LFNSPAGMLVDKTRHFRLWVALALLAVVGGTLATLPARSFAAVLAAQSASAFGGALMAPAVTALTLGIVGKGHFPRQQGRNQAWNHAGNVAAAGLVAAATAALGAASAFWVLAGMAAASATMLLSIPGSAIDTQRASGHADAEPTVSFAQILGDRPLLILGLALLLFHLGNAAMLPLPGQRMAAIGHGDASAAGWLPAWWSRSSPWCRWRS
jgi:predicted MFS family arabinose efflux permease